MDENFAWLTQKTEDRESTKGKTEDPESNKGNLTPPSPLHTHRVNAAVAPPPISTSTPPPFRIYPPFLTKNFVPAPQVTRFLEGSTSPF